MNSKLVLLESPSGSGHMIPRGGGAAIKVHYEVRVYQRMIEAMPGEFIPGGLRIEGKVWNLKDQLFALRNVGKYYTLCLADGRKLDFFFRDQDASIANTGPGLYAEAA